MSNLINIQNQDGKKLVSARDLYIGLGLAKDQWSRWYKKNIQDNEYFKENYDFTGVRHNVEGNEVQDFAITLEFAKHIAMMARTEKSHEYRNYFIECEQQLKQPMCLEDLIIANAKALKDAREQAEKAQATALEVKQEVQAMRDVVTLDPAAWRTETTNLVNRIAQKLGGNENIQAIRKESYDILDSRAKAKLGIRQTNMKRKVLEETGSTSKSNKVSKLDVIAADARLREVYIAIVKEMAIKYGVA
ncbi:phage antirepressor Ant [Sporanaerobium hydrogeniformans]|uniref:Phage antirepressor Ant n=1 Tax=Sporanaerobium hydrogeniformans TaxID=3072179 RepID=A0AC61DA58_9FIRM|nr:antA/AntB antirepressor family protein [Sporanaerobium hydrogeniformans]PHV69561.1 phage antirepressor Ant [Sporanaerobium hydrogeniformans]